MLVKRNKKTSYILIVFAIIFYYMLRVTTLVDNNNGIWHIEYFATVFNELYKLNTQIDITRKNLIISIGVSFLCL